MFCACFVEITLFFRNDRCIAVFIKLEARMIKFNIGCDGNSMKMLRRVKEISSHFSGGAFSRENSFSDSLHAYLAWIPSWIIGSVGFLIVGFVYSSNFFLIGF